MSSFQMSPQEDPGQALVDTIQEVTQDAGPGPRIGENLAPFNPSMQPVVDTALELLALTDSDVLYELGCGDGRVMIAAAIATPGLRCVGIEYDAEYAERARRAVETAGLEERVSVIHGNVLDVYMSDATSVFVYLVPKGMKLVAPMLKSLVDERGGRIVSYIFSVPGRERGKTAACPITLH
mmetsp:Transcript_30029/g.50649  ORF Transcript_30029/g.50649 Transcript_30029/m.50649 type:complete len:181 (+) Transcript_30029:33-575(+)